MARNRARYEEALSKGHSYSWDQRWPEAIQEFKKAIAALDNEPAAYAGLGMAYFEMNELEKALENYKLASRYSKGDIIYLRQVADVQERLGKLSEAGQTYMAIGEIQLRLRNLSEAMGNWLRAVRLEPGLVGGHQRLATVYQRQGQARNAIREYLAIARIFSMRGDKDKALQTCQAALRLDPRNADVLTAIELIQHGEDFSFEEEELLVTDAASGASVTDAVQRMALVFEEEQAGWQLRAQDGQSNPVYEARQMALEQLAEELFKEEEVAAEDLSGSSSGLAKLERDALVSQALDFQTRGLSDEAISCLRRAIDAGLNIPAAHFNLGLLYQDKLQLDDAIREFELAAESDDYRLAGYFALGEAQRASGRIDKTVVNFIHVLRLLDLANVGQEETGEVTSSYHKLTDTLLSSSEPELATRFVNATVEFLSRPEWRARVSEAQTRLDALSSRSQRMILGNMLLAGSEQVLESLFLSKEYAKREAYDSAVEEAYRAIQLSPEYLPGHVQLAELLIKQDRMNMAVAKLVIIGDTYRARGDISGAADAYERALQLSALDVDTRKRLIGLLLEYNDIDRCLEHYLALGEAYYNLAQIDDARNTYQEALKLAPRGSPERHWRTRLLRLAADIDMQRFDWKRALVAYSELHTEDPDDERLALTLVDLYFKLKSPKNALRTLDRFLIHLVKTGRAARIAAVLKEVLEARPNEAGLVKRLARLYIQQRQTSEAVRLLDQLGEAQLDAGETQNAIGTIEMILELNPPNAAGYRQLLQRLQQDSS